MSTVSLQTRIETKPTNLLYLYIKHDKSLTNLDNNLNINDGADVPYNYLLIIIVNYFIGESLIKPEIDQKLKTIYQLYQNDDDNNAYFINTKSKYKLYIYDQRNYFIKYHNKPTIMDKRIFYTNEIKDIILTIGPIIVDFNQSRNIINDENLNSHFRFENIFFGDPEIKNIMATKSTRFYIMDVKGIKTKKACHRK